MARPRTTHDREVVPVQRGAGPRDRLLLSVDEAAEQLAVSRAFMWTLLSRGDIESVHVGRLRRIEPDALTRYVARIRSSGSSGAARS